MGGGEEVDMDPSEEVVEQFEGVGEVDMMGY